MSFYFLIFVILIFTAAWMFFAPKKNVEEMFKVTGLELLIPFRNEEKNLPYLFQYLDEQEGISESQVNILLIDDASEDHSLALAEKWQKETNYKVKILRNTEALGKKASIKKLFEKSNKNWLLFTDADCRPQNNWLQSMMKISKNAKMQLGAVWITDQGLFGKIQRMEFAAMQMTAKACVEQEKPFLASAANMMVHRELFSHYLFHDENQNRSSGDDMFLLDFAIKNKQKISWNSQSKVFTNQVETFKEFVDQRVRWFAKSQYYKSSNLQFWSFFFGLWGILTLILLWVQMTYGTTYWNYILFAKFIIDGIALGLFYKKYQQKFEIDIYLMMIVFHPIILIWIGFSALFYRPKWKGNKINR
ncbi:MAG: glycosyltransferase [Flavobacteriales bacterium]|jgi:cellulose synthase/poly-beta-1,6-N-acetylglucosamine synthase-like glycosyltransferase|nr:glycosyltransferase [Flavobacteriales bacterium]